MPPPLFPLVHIDAFSGASGDMFLGALVDLGYPMARLRQTIAAIPVDGIKLRRKRVTRQGWSAVHVEVKTAADQPHRGRREIRSLLRRARLDHALRRQALAVFENIIEVEAEIHHLDKDRVHLHEVGALDALADVVGTLDGFRHLGVEKVHCGPVNLGHGIVACEHGDMPIPAPATAALLSGVPVFARGSGEKTTPTGAALIVALAGEYGPLPPMRIAALGHGAGSRDDTDGPNLLRLMAGEPVVQGTDTAPGGSLMEMRAQLDDMDPRLCGHLMERLLVGGARDVYFVPIQMKKNRPGVLVVILATPEQAGDLGRVLLDETPTLGYRQMAVQRVERPRRFHKVMTPFGEVRIKVADGPEAAPLGTPEYEDCRRLATAANVPLRQVLAAAIAAWHTAAPPRRRRRPR